MIPISLQLCLYIQNLIMSGDLNVKQNYSIDIFGGRQTYIAKSQNCLYIKMIEFKLVDVWRSFNPELQGYTWKWNKPKIKYR